MDSCPTAFSGEATPPIKPREQVLRNVWGPDGEPGAPMRGVTRKRRQQPHLSGYPEDDEMSCEDGEAPCADLDPSPVRRAPGRFAGARDRFGTDEASLACASKLAVEPEPMTFEPMAATPVRRSRPSLFDALANDTMTPAKPLRNGPSRNLFLRSSYSADELPVLSDVKHSLSCGSL